MVPDGDAACKDVRWFCANIAECSSRLWTPAAWLRAPGTAVEAADPPGVPSDPSAPVETNFDIKQSAMDFAIRYGQSQPGQTDTPEKLLLLGDQLASWLGSATVAFSLVVAPTTYEQSDPSKGTPTVRTPGGAVQLHDTQQVAYTVQATDTKGQPVTESDSLTWTSSDETIFTVAADPGNMSATVVAGNVGSAVLTVSDGTRNATDAIDVIPGDIAAINLTAGTPEDQPPPA